MYDNLKYWSMVLVVTMVSTLISSVVIFNKISTLLNTCSRYQMFVGARVNYTIDSIRHVTRNKGYEGHVFYIYNDQVPPLSVLREISVLHRESIYYKSFTDCKHVVVVPGLSALRWKDIEVLLTNVNRDWVQYDGHGYYVSNIRLHKVT